jgi:hypothetical protein
MLRLEKKQLILSLKQGQGEQKLEQRALKNEALWKNGFEVG